MAVVLQLRSLHLFIGIILILHIDSRSAKRKNNTTSKTAALDDQKTDASNAAAEAVSEIQEQAKLFQDFFSVQLSPHEVEFGHVCEDPHSWEQRYEKKDYKNYRDMGKVRWGDKNGAYGEHYWDLNHAGVPVDSENAASNVNNDYDGQWEQDRKKQKQEKNPEQESEEEHHKAGREYSAEVGRYIEHLKKKNNDDDEGYESDYDYEEPTKSAENVEETPEEKPVRREPTTTRKPPQSSKVKEEVAPKPKKKDKVKQDNPVELDFSPVYVDTLGFEPVPALPTVYPLLSEDIIGMSPPKHDYHDESSEFDDYSHTPGPLLIYDHASGNIVDLITGKIVY